MDDPKVLLVLGLLVAALFVLALVLGGTQGDQFAVPDPEDPGAMGSLEGFLHGLPGLGPGRDLRPGDLARTRCGNGRDLAWNGRCTVVLPDGVGTATFELLTADRVRVELEQEDAVDDRFVLPRDARRGRLTVRSFGDGDVLHLVCQEITCRLRLVEGG